MRKYLVPALAAVAALAIPQAAQAEPIWSPISGEWLVTLKGHLVASPAYPGSQDTGLALAPGIAVRRAGTPLAFSAPDDNISFAILDQGWFKFGPSGKFIAARTSSDHRELTGLRTVDWTIEAGLFAEFWTSENIRLRADVRHGFHGHRGIVADLGADWVQRHGPWTLSAGPRLVLANSRYMTRMFGVTPAESLANGVLPAYRPDGGVKSAGVTAAASYDWSPNWRTTLWGRYDRLVSSAAASPIASIAGSRNQYTLGATIAYTFNLNIP